MRNVGASIVELDKGKRYRIFAELPRDPKTGKRRRLTKTVRGTRKDAERARLELMIEADNPREPITLEDFFYTLYLPDAKTRLRPNTCHGYERKFSLLKPLWSKLLSKITPLAVKTFLDSVNGQNRKFQAYKMLKQVLARAVRWDLLDSNPCSRVDVPKIEKYRPEVLNTDGVRAYLSAFEGTFLFPCILIAIGGGLRRSELAALLWDDIKPDGTLTVSRAVTSVAGKPHDDKPKTQFSERTIHLPSSIMEKLEPLRQNGMPLVTDSNGNPMNPDNISKYYKEIRDTLPEDVPRIPLKNLRHTSLTLALESGADLLAVSRRAGHSNVAITSAYYLRPDESLDKKTAASMDDFLKL